MVLMSAKWAGTCRRCGKPILTGTPMDWTQEGGPFHVTPEECEGAAATAPPLRGPQPEDPEQRMRIAELLLAHPWKSATSKRYAKLPHQYTLRKQWANDEDFIWCVEYIRRVGYQERFIGRVWTYLDVGEFQYWTMGSPVPETTLINRALRRPPAARL
jgi:hypothetical protein